MACNSPVVAYFFFPIGFISFPCYSFPVYISSLVVASFLLLLLLLLLLLCVLSPSRPNTYTLSLLISSSSSSFNSVVYSCTLSLSHTCSLTPPRRRCCCYCCYCCCCCLCLTTCAGDSNSCLPRPGRQIHVTCKDYNKRGNRSRMRWECAIICRHSAPQRIELSTHHQHHAHRHTSHTHVHTHTHTQIQQQSSSSLSPTFPPSSLVDFMI